MRKLIKKKDFVLTLIYKNYDKLILQFDSVSLDLSYVQTDSKLSLELAETTDTSYNFADIGWVIVDLFIHEKLSVTRKIFQVNFSRYYQEYQRNNGEFASYILEFEVLKFEVRQDDEIDSIESLIRLIKLDQFLD
jgi:hypothetical protein